VHVGKLTDEQTRVKMSLLAQILQEPAFNVLRTKEQLGYVVFCHAWPLAGSGDGGIRLAVQSERDPVYVEERVEAFLDSMKSVIEAMGPEEFKEQKLGLKQKWEEVPKRMGEENLRYWEQIKTGHLDFFRRKQALSYRRI
jgi:insulysin